MRKNGYSKKILMLLAGLTSTCYCSAMEDRILKRLCQEEYQKTLDKKFGLVDPRKTKGDIIPTIEQILEIFNNEIKPLHDEAYRIHKNKLSSVGLNLSPPQIIDRMSERVTLLRPRNGSSCIEEHSLSHYTMAKLGAWNCRSVACAMKEFLQKLRVNRGSIYEPKHTSVVTLVDVSKDMEPLFGSGIRAMVLECLENKNNPQDIQYDLYAAQYLKRLEYVDEPFFPDYSKTINLRYTIVDHSERYSIPLFVLFQMLNPNFKMGEKETTVLRNKILDELRRLISSGTMLGMPFSINEKNFFEVCEIDTKDLLFLGSKEMNKDMIIKKYMIDYQNFKELKKTLKMNSKWKDVKKYFTFFKEMTVPADLSKLWSFNE